MKKNALIFSILYLFIGCAVSRTARMYDLNNGVVISGEIKSANRTQGALEFVHPATGERFVGEYTSIPDDSTAFTLFNSGYYWAQAYGLTYNRSTKILGTATLIGNKGTVIDLIYSTNRRNLHGFGVGRDNKGNHYKVHC